MGEATLSGNTPSRAERKAEWLRYSGLDIHPEDRWLRDKVGSLFDIETPNEDERLALSLADNWLSMWDLPVAGDPKHKAKLMALVEKLCGRYEGLRRMDDY